MNLIYSISIIFFSFLGLLLSLYIAKTKRIGKHLVCPLGHECDTIINSRFSRFLGLRVEYIGIFYYFIVAISYISILIFNIPKNIIFYILLVSSIAFVFSLYLIFIQLILLKKWCTTCIGSFVLSFFIIIASFLGFEASFGAYLFGIHDILGWLFMASIFVGIISTSLYAKIFIRFLKDFKISKKESNRLAMFSHTALVAIAITFFSGLSIVLTDVYGNFTENSKFMVIIIILGILLVYEIVVNMIIAPKLIDIHFGNTNIVKMEEHKHSMMRKTAFGFVAIGVVSWYFLLLLSSIDFYGYSSAVLLIIYLILVIVTVAISMYAEHIFYKKSTLLNK